MYYREDKKTKELKALYDEKEKWVQDKITMEAEYSKSWRIMEEEISLYKKEIQWLEKERIWLEKENELHKNLPGFTLDILSEGEREALKKEIA